MCCCLVQFDPGLRSDWQGLWGRGGSGNRGGTTHDRALKWHQHARQPNQIRLWITEQLHLNVFGMFLCVIPDQIFPLPEQGIKSELCVRTSRTVSHLHDAHDYRFMAVWWWRRSSPATQSTVTCVQRWVGSPPKVKKKQVKKRWWGGCLKRLIHIGDVRADEFEPRENVSS